MNEEKHLRTFHLLRKHEVFETQTGYKVSHTDGNDEKHVREVSPAVADILFAECEGKSVTSGEAADKLKQVTHRLELPYTHGHKLRYFAQTVLLVLAATGRATFEKEGHGYRYRIRQGD